jgi:hypothetical protein
MVATRLVEVTAKGTEWAYGGGAAQQQPAAPPGDNALLARESRSFTAQRRTAEGAAGGAYSPSSSASSSPSPSGYDSPSSRSVSPFSSTSRGGAAAGSLSSPYSWRGGAQGDDSYGNQSFLQKAAEATYALMSQAIASLYSSGGSGGYYDDTTTTSSGTCVHRTRSHSTMGAESTDQLSLSGRDGGGDDGGSLISSRPVRRKSFTLAPGDLVMLFQNPYSKVRGRDHNSSKPASISAVRALLALVPVTSAAFDEGRYRGRLPTAESPLDDNAGEGPTMSGKNDGDSKMFVQMTPLISNLSPAPDRISPLASPIGDGGGVFRQDSQGLMPLPTLPPQEPTRHSRDDNALAVSPSETASQIAEGTIRAMRDLLCDEAVDLRTSLRFWTERWERPVYSWLEAGPHGTAIPSAMSDDKRCALPSFKF